MERRSGRDVYLQTVMRFFRSTATLLAEAFFDVRPRAMAVWTQPDSIQTRPLCGVRTQARTSPLAGPASFQHPVSSADGDDDAAADAAEMSKWKVHL